LHLHNAQFDLLSPAPRAAIFLFTWILGLTPQALR